PRRDRHWKIPRGNQRADANRLSSANCKFVWQLCLGSESVESSSLTSDEISHIDRFLDVATSLIQHLTHLTCHICRKLFFTLDEYLTCFEENFRATWCGYLAPLWEGFCRSSDGAIDIFSIGCRENTD